VGVCCIVRPHVRFFGLASTPDRPIKLSVKCWDSTANNKAVVVHHMEYRMISRVLSAWIWLLMINLENVISDPAIKTLLSLNTLIRTSAGQAEKRF